MSLNRRCAACGRTLTVPDVAAEVWPSNESEQPRQWWCLPCWDNDDELALRQYQQAGIAPQDRGGQVRSALVVDDPRHGTTNGYVNRGCRCSECRTAWAAWNRAARYRRAKNIDPADPRHGTHSFYTNHGCRCALCLRGYRVYNRDYWQRKLDEEDK